MSINFDEDIFGQLVKPENALKKKKSDKKTRATRQPHVKLSFNQSNKAGNNFLIFSNNQNDQRQQQCFMDEHNWKGQSKAQTKDSYDYSSIYSTQANSQKKSKKLKKTLENQAFQWEKQKLSQSIIKTLTCKNQNRISGNDNLVKFFEYMIQYKLGSHQSTSKQTARQSSKIKEPQKQSILSRGSLSRTSFGLQGIEQIKEKIQENKNKHIGFQCDFCLVNPIEGIRYHCSDQECFDDYDLCEQCFQRMGHRHQDKIAPIESTDINRNIEVALNYLNRSSIQIERKSKISGPRLSSNIFHSAIN